MISVWRVLASLGCFALIGALVSSVARPKVQEVHWSLRVTMIILLLVVAFSQIDRIGTPLTARLPAVSLAVVLGLWGILRSPHKESR